MLVVDSSVWIDFFGGAITPAVGALETLLQRGEVRVVVPDLVLTHLHYDHVGNFRGEREQRSARSLMEGLAVEATGGAALALAATDHYRILRSQGFTVRGTVDVWVAAFCIEHDYFLLHRDRDFDAFERLRGLRVWPVDPTGKKH